MNLFEMMSGNLQSAQNSPVFPFGAQPDRNISGSRENSSFGAILDTKLNSAERQARSVTNRNTALMKKTSGEGAAKTENRPKYLTFQEANANIRKTAESDMHSKVVETLREPEKTTEAGADDRKKNVRADMPGNFLNICAELLGIDKGELQKLLDKAGISLDSLKDAAGFMQASADLSQLLGLNIEQAGALKELFSAAAESLGLIEAGQTAETNATDEQAVEVAQKDLKTAGAENTAYKTAAVETKLVSESTPVNDEFLYKLAAQISDKLDEISARARMDNNTVEDELKNLMKPLLEKAEIAAKTVQQGTQTSDGEIQPVVTDDTAQTQAAATLEKESDKDSATADEDGRNGDADAKTTQKAVVSQPEQSLKATPAQIQYQAVQDAKQAIATAEKTPEAAVKPRELISQIIDKAKVILSPDKSEMLIDLKPDSLGKLSLKVVTENGMVMAKFIADNQQVREILESNMQLLKDSLEKQGMNVQGFSVSVRQDHRDSDTNRPQYGMSGNPAVRTSRNVSGQEAQTMGIFEANTERNPYRWEDSTINLTA